MASLLCSCMASQMYDVAAVWDRTTSDPLVSQGPWLFTAVERDDYLCCYLPVSSLRRQPDSSGVASQWLDDTKPPQRYSAVKTLMHAPACVSCLVATGVAVACPRQEGAAARLVGEDKWEERCCAGCPWKHSKRCRRRNLQAAFLLEQAETQSQAAASHFDQQAEVGSEP